jgi:hypothetical protein
VTVTHLQVVVLPVLKLTIANLLVDSDRVALQHVHCSAPTAVPCTLTLPGTLRSCRLLCR